MRRLAIGGSALGVATLLAGTGEPQAAGFALKEQSTTAQGNAFAGATAGVDDVSYMFFNPASLGWLAEDRAAGGGDRGGPPFRAEERGGQHRVRHADRRPRP